MSFETLGIESNLLSSITALGFTQPTPIQEKAIPVLLSGTRDFIGLAQTGTVKVEELFGIYSFPQVHQMISTVSSKPVTPINNIEVIKRAFPMGSMTGAPKIMAMQLIERYEQTQRGLYSGAVGYFAPNGNFDFNVVIRSLQYNAQHKYLSYEVGSAITYDSIPEQEYEECLLKAEAMLAVLA